MATSSFDKHFKVGGKAAKKFLKDLDNCRADIVYTKRDISKESKKGAEILKQRLLSN